MVWHEGPVNTLPSPSKASPSGGVKSVQDHWRQLTAMTAKEKDAVKKKNAITTL
jgi:hypothetical protein